MSVLTSDLPDLLADLRTRAEAAGVAWGEPVCVRDEAERCTGYGFGRYARTLWLTVPDADPAASTWDTTTGPPFGSTAVAHGTVDDLFAGYRWLVEG